MFRVCKEKKIWVINLISATVLQKDLKLIFYDNTKKTTSIQVYRTYARDLCGFCGHGANKFVSRNEKLESKMFRNM